MELTIRCKDFGEIRGKENKIKTLLKENTNKEFYLVKAEENENVIFLGETALQQPLIEVLYNQYKLSIDWPIDNHTLKALGKLKYDVYIKKFINQS